MRLLIALDTRGCGVSFPRCLENRPAAAARIKHSIAGKAGVLQQFHIKPSWLFSGVALVAHIGHPDHVRADGAEPLSTLGGKQNQFMAAAPSQRVCRGVAGAPFVPDEWRPPRLPAVARDNLLHSQELINIAEQVEMRSRLGDPIAFPGDALGRRQGRIKTVLIVVPEFGRGTKGPT